MDAAIAVGSAVKGVVVAVVDDVSAASALSVDVVAELAVVVSWLISIGSLRAVFVAVSVELSSASAVSADSAITSSAVNGLLSCSRST